MEPPSAESCRMGNILVVEDDATLLATLKYNLERDGHLVVTAPDGESALRTAQQQKVQLVILDLLLPGMHGFEVCRRLRQEISAPIIILTALTDEVDRVVGLELGADDYVTKPFSMKELIARVQARLRRAGMRPVGKAEALTSGDLEVDLRSRRASLRGQHLPLKPKEYELLAFLMQNRGCVLTRRQLLDRVWNQETAGRTRTLDVHIGRLRTSIEDDPRHPRRIVTVPSLGYRFDA